MKPISFILCLLFLVVSCGKDNTSGKSPNKSLPDTFLTDAEITQVTNTRNGVMVQGTQMNFAIQVTNVTNIYRSKNLVGVIYNNNGLRVKIYNALGQAVFNENILMRDPAVNVGDDVATIDYFDSRGNARVLAVNTAGKILLSFRADGYVRAKAKHGVAAITYRVNNTSRAVAVHADGRVLLPDNRTYISPSFIIDLYVLYFRHSQDQVQIPH